MVGDGPASSVLIKPPPVKEGHVSSIASKFQQQEKENSTNSAGSASSAGSNNHQYNVVGSRVPLSTSLDSSSLLLSSPTATGNPTTAASSAALPKNSTSVRKVSSDKTAAFFSRKISSTSSADDLLNSANGLGPDGKPKKPVTRTESHHARFNTARAMFEKMGSADDLDSDPPPVVIRPRVSLRASSVGRNNQSDHQNNRPNSRSSEEATGDSGSTKSDSFRQSAAFFRSRSTSPFTGSRSPSQENQPANNNNNIQSNSNVDNNSNSSNGVLSSEQRPSRSVNRVSTGSMPSNSILGSTAHNSEAKTNGISGSASFQNGLAETTTGLVKSRRLSFQQKSDQEKSESSSNQENASSKPRPNVKELTNKQRNWFPNFEKGKTPNATVTENVDSARRTSVKNDNTPQLLSGKDEANPVPPANLELPGDRRPLSARTSTSSDSIEDYLRNWKKSNPTGEPPKEDPNQNEEKPAPAGASSR